MFEKFLMYKPVTSMMAISTSFSTWLSGSIPYETSCLVTLSPVKAAHWNYLLWLWDQSFCRLL